MDSARKPGDMTSGEFRHVLGHLATGVTVITAYTPDGQVGMAANSVVSVSLDPPLILFCPARTSTTWPAIRAAGHYCVNIMAAHHEQAARHFSRRDVDRFAGRQCQRRSSGPALSDAVGWIECSLQAEHVAGDHTLVISDVLAVEAASEIPPLVFFRGRYGTFSEAVDAHENELRAAGIRAAPADEAGDR